MNTHKHTQTQKDTSVPVCMCVRTHHINGLVIFRRGRARGVVSEEGGGRCERIPGTKTQVVVC